MIVETFLLFSVYLAYRAYIAGEFGSVPEFGVDKAKFFQGRFGIEDVEAVDGVLFGTQDDRSWLKLFGIGEDTAENIAAVPDGAIVRIDLNDPTVKDFLASDKKRTMDISSTVFEMELQGFSHEFHPQGISVRPSTSGKGYTIAVVNNKPHERVLEIFHLESIDSSVLVHVRTVRHRFFRWLNDVYLTSDSSLFTTNWLYNSPGDFKCFAEGILMQPLGYTLYCELDNERAHCKKVLEGQRLPNGVTVLPSGQVAVVQSLGKSVSIYDRSKDNSLTLAREVKTNSSCDNLDISKDGRLLSGCHPKDFTFVAHEAFRTPAPTQILAVDPVSGEQQLLASTNSNGFSAASGATVSGEYMYVGSVYSDGIMILPAT